MVIHTSLARSSATAASVATRKRTSFGWNMANRRLIAAASPALTRASRDAKSTSVTAFVPRSTDEQSAPTAHTWGQVFVKYEGDTGLESFLTQQRSGVVGAVGSTRLTGITCISELTIRPLSGSSDATRTDHHMARNSPLLGHCV